MARKAKEVKTPGKRGRPSKAAKELAKVQETLVATPIIVPPTPRPKVTPEARLAKFIAERDAEYTTKYPHYVSGSMRLSTPEDLDGKAKKFVGLVRFPCGDTRLVSTSDIFQVKSCKLPHGRVAELKKELAEAKAQENATSAPSAA